MNSRIVPENCLSEVEKAVEVDKRGGGKYGKIEQLVVERTGNLGVKTAMAAMEVDAAAAVAAIWLPKKESASVSLSLYY